MSKTYAELAGFAIVGAAALVFAVVGWHTAARLTCAVLIVWMYVPTLRSLNARYRAEDDRRPSTRRT